LRLREKALKGDARSLDRLLELARVLVVESERERLLRDEEMLALRRWRAASAPRNITNVTQYPIVEILL
jgi:hypothetical protein